MKLYQEQTVIKQNEEKELIKVHGDYKKKYDEFESTMKKTRQGLKTCENEIKERNKKITIMEKQKKEMQKATKQISGQ